MVVVPPNVLLWPQLGFASQPWQTKPLSDCTTTFDAQWFLETAASQPARTSHTLRALTTPLPSQAFVAVTLVSGCHTYYRRLPQQSTYDSWWYSQCYAAWGRRTKTGSLIFTPGRAARTSAGYGAIYSRWPAFDGQGEQTGYDWELATVEFGVRDRHAQLDDRLQLMIKRQRGHVGLGHARQHSLNLGSEDHNNLPAQLATAAQAGFNRHCSDYLDQDSDPWMAWFRRQEAMMAEQGEVFRSFCLDHGWVEAFDGVEDAWQLAVALETYRHLFPLRPPGLELLSDPGLDLKEVKGELTIRRDPGYEGSVASREARLLGAYYELRPAREELLESWMDGYVSLLGRER